MKVGGHGGVKDDWKNAEESSSSSDISVVSKAYRTHVPWSPSTTQYNCDISVSEWPDDEDGWKKLCDDLVSEIKSNNKTLHISSKELNQMYASVQVALQDIKAGRKNHVSFRTSNSTYIDGQFYMWESEINIGR